MAWSNTRYIILSASDFILTAFFYYLYRHKKYLWNAVKSATLISSITSHDKLTNVLNSDPHGQPAYVAVEGIIEPTQTKKKGYQQVITSDYRPEANLRAVCRVITTEERHIRRSAGNWYEVTRVIGKDVTHVPASIFVSLADTKKSVETAIQPEEKKDKFTLSSIYSPYAWGRAVVAGSKYVWKGVTKISGYKSDESIPEKKTEPVKELSFALPALSLADEMLHEDGCLTQVHSDFETKQQNVLESIGQVVFGNVLLGTVKREKMLLCGTRVFAFANLDPNDSSLNASVGKYRLKISSQSGSEMPFIITCFTPEQLAAKLKTPVIVFGFLTMLGVAGLCALGFRFWKQRQEEQFVLERTRQLRNDAIDRRKQQAQSGELNETTFNIDSACVICLENRRDIALLPCGHVCMCSACYRQLADPQLCPLCREEIADITMLFFS